MELVEVYRFMLWWREAKISFWTVATCEHTSVHNVDLNTSTKLENQMDISALIHGVCL